MASRQQPVAAGMSAAALLDFPIVGRWPNHAYLLSRRRSSRKRRGVIELPRLGSEIMISRNGVLLTSIADTLIEVCRTAPFLTAVSMVDAALHVVRYGGPPPLTTLDELWNCHNERLPYRGSVRVARILAMATTEAGLPIVRRGRSFL